MFTSLPERFDFRYDDGAKKTLLLAKEEKTGTSMAKPIITLNGLKIVIMLGMLVYILCGIRFAAEIIVPFILALFIAVILNPLVQHMV
ncbi:hypothetical protein VZ115_24855, partial [Enterobacter ludwigii]|nr:hypothetical protein [Enterobacter ludwigii]